MKREDVFSMLTLILGIAVVIGLAILIGTRLFGEKGIIDQYKEADVEYNKTEIVEKMNLIIKQKYVLDYKYASENNENIEEIYTEDAVFNYLLEEKYIEPLRDINDNLVEDQYYINPDALNSDISTAVLNENGSESNGTKLFKLKIIEDKYMIYFVDKYGEEEELGELILKPEV